jgi:hypothetical protein
VELAFATPDKVAPLQQLFFSSTEASPPSGRMLTLRARRAHTSLLPGAGRRPDAACVLLPWPPVATNCWLSLQVMIFSVSRLLGLGGICALFHEGMPPIKVRMRAPAYTPAENHLLHTEGKRVC